MSGLADTGELSRWKERLTEAARAADSAIAERDAIHRIVEGLEALARLTRRPAVGQESLPIPEAAAPASQAAETVSRNGTKPLGREAVRRILAESPETTWRVGPLTQEIERRGWIKKQARDKKGAVRQAMAALVAAGVAERADIGEYRLAVNQKIPDVSSGMTAGLATYRKEDEGSD